ncbi:hypothetical protein CEUSTIGMA_g11575.t1 [Chlamydomonas eustigma]|uniref:3-beta hydroxysteroid dehydrogenase/isomerase domain-containing protein n=1 Tax=Chlamydomonas eustigma TaxID=1157962 RepID=A0A250XMM8_9CHLO|nr:hypothetical protein CEUSTIGMA_g11575.t1 [Chlamydomonas eustigma]|eukprot:GAX84152.1 hypothetical protein CEUSTIGMA_g11575.t1 [Chlamydomonas eustigma]
MIHHVTYAEGDMQDKEHLRTLLKGCSCCILMSLFSEEHPSKVLTLQGCTTVVEACLLQDVRNLVLSSSVLTGLISNGQSHVMDLAGLLETLKRIFSGSLALVDLQQLFEAEQLVMVAG